MVIISTNLSFIEWGTTFNSWHPTYGIIESYGNIKFIIRNDLSIYVNSKSKKTICHRPKHLRSTLPKLKIINK